MSSIEITIPILNEQESIAERISTLVSYLSNNQNELNTVSLVLADNGSSDSTPIVAEKLVAKYPHIKFIRVNEKGVGRALKASWEQSNADIIGYMDLDLATDLQHLGPCLNLLLEDKADIVTGTRLAKESIVIGRSKLRSFTSRCFNYLLRVMFNTKISDGMCGFKFLKKRYYPILHENGATSDGWFFATEILLVGEHIGLRVVSVPVKWTDDAKSKVRIISLSLNYLKQMYRLRKRFANHDKI